MYHSSLSQKQHGLRGESILEKDNLSLQKIFSKHEIKNKTKQKHARTMAASKQAGKKKKSIGINEKTWE